MSNHQEFPAMTLAAQAAAIISLGYSIDRMDSVEIHRHYRKQLAAFLREAMKQADPLALAGSCCRWGELEDIAASLHNPPPPPPTLAEAREADLSTPEGQTTVNAFLALLGEGVQP